MGQDGNGGKFDHIQIRRKAWPYTNTKLPHTRNKGLRAFSSVVIFFTNGWPTKGPNGLEQASGQFMSGRGKERGSGERQGEWGMVEMGVANQYPVDPLAPVEPGEDRLQMRGRRRARVDHRDPSGADEEGVGAPIGHRRGVGGEDAADAGGDPLDRTGFWAGFWAGPRPGLRLGQGR